MAVEGQVYIRFTVPLSRWLSGLRVWLENERFEFDAY